MLPDGADAGATLAVKGHRPVVPTRDNKGLLDVFAVVNLISAALHANTLESPKDAKKKTGKSKTRRMQEAFADHLRHVGRVYPRDEHKEVVLLIDNAPWHRAGPIDEALADNPHWKFKRLPRYSPQLNPIERFWKVLRRRATHNRLFDAVATSRSRSAPASATSRPCVIGSRPWSTVAASRRQTRQYQRACE